MPIAVTTTPGRGAPRPHPLLFVHGAWQGGWVWREHFTGWFAEHGWTCHTFDLRHHGTSGGPGSLRRSRIRHYVADLAEVVAGLERPPVLVAHSMGGLIAQRYLERTDLPGCVLLAPIPIGGVWRVTLRTFASHPLKFLQANVTMNLKPLVDTPRMARQLLFDPDITNDELGRYVPLLQGESYLAFLDMLIVTRSRPPLVHTNVAFITGDRDGIFGVREITKTARAYDLAPTVLPDSGHQLMMGSRWEKAAEAVARALEAF
ncbi:MAG: hypothetical protein A2Z12_03955 [Actinobacteria bacterium RBG_16_68_21]|nr:MAG: hypothetical protein A2Z12_03955 [Actinobacteria bacterium RBG_16_68_21]